MVRYLRIFLLGLVLLQSTHPSWGVCTPRYQTTLMSENRSAPRSRTCGDTACDVLKGGGYFFVGLLMGVGAGVGAKIFYDSLGVQNSNATSPEFGNSPFPCSNGTPWFFGNQTGCLQKGEFLAATEDNYRLYEDVKPPVPAGYTDETRALVIVYPCLVKRRFPPTETLPGAVKLKRGKAWRIRGVSGSMNKIRDGCAVGMPVTTAQGALLAHDWATHQSGMPPSSTTAYWVDKNGDMRYVEPPGWCESLRTKMAVCVNSFMDTLSAVNQCGVTRDSVH